VTDDRETLTYELFGTASRELAEQVVADGYEPDLIPSIARGGLFLAGALGYALDVKNLFVMNVEFYTGVDERLDLPVVLPPTLDQVDLTGANVLIADDVAGNRQDPRARPRLLRGVRRRCPDGGRLREALLGRDVRLRVAAHRPVDQLPLVDAASGRPAQRPPRALTRTGTENGGGGKPPTAAVPPRPLR
jgi:hypothetical protein